MANKIGLNELYAMAERMGESTRKIIEAAKVANQEQREYIVELKEGITRLEVALEEISFLSGGDLGHKNIHAIANKALDKIP